MVFRKENNNSGLPIFRWSALRTNSFKNHLEYFRLSSDSFQQRFKLSRIHLFKMKNANRAESTSGPAYRCKNCITLNKKLYEINKCSFLLQRKSFVPSNPRVALATNEIIYTIKSTSVLVAKGAFILLNLQVIPLEEKSLVILNPEVILLQRKSLVLSNPRVISSRKIHSVTYK